MKNNATTNKNWNDYHIKIKSNQLFSIQLLEFNINKFWKEIVSSISDNSHILLLTRIKRINGQFVTIGKLQRLNKTDKDYLIEFLKDQIEIKSDSYINEQILQVTFSYGIKEGKIERTEINTDVKLQSHYKYKFPVSFDPLDYGTLIEQVDNKYWLQVNKVNSVVITCEDDINKVKLFKSGKLLFTWEDRKVDANTFIRTIDRNQYTFENNELKLTTISKPSKYITPLKEQNTINDKFLTLDIETTLNDENKHTPYAICFFDGVVTKSYYIADFYYNPELMFQACIKDLCIRKYKNYKVYVHNLARFDAIFLLKTLVNFANGVPVIHKGKIISIQINYNNIPIEFKDSYLLLLSSLRNLGSSFNVDTQKGIFPYLLSDINYSGEYPDYKYFTGITLDQYLSYKKDFGNKIWSFRTESINYCNIDCISLYQILIKFNQLIFSRFKLNIAAYPTLPSLSFAIFRCKYLGEDTLCTISGQIYKDIKKSYTGGAVDMYIPRNDQGEKIYCYDVNSLYPSQMLTQEMPVSNPTYFEGDIRKFNKDAFGFFFCKIVTPAYLDHPILQTHVKTSGGLRTIAPLGTWEDMIFSKEMDNCIKKGYKFEIQWGYTFTPGLIFDTFVKDLYQIRLDFPKSDPMNYIAKIILNSLYGRFGMDDNFSVIDLLDDADLEKLISKQADSIIDIIKLGKFNLVQYSDEVSIEKTLLDNASETHNINIAVASAITGYARIVMSYYKNNPNFKIYYTDTDSVYIDKPLSEDLVSATELGKMKLEHVIKKGIFLAPKVYGLETTDGQTIIKVKGLTKNVISKMNIADLEGLLTKDSKLEFNQDKWFRVNH